MLPEVAAIFGILMDADLVSGFFGLLGVIVGSAITAIVQWIIHKDRQYRSAKYLAIKVTNILDDFIDECTMVVQDNGIRCGKDPHPDVVTPEFRDPSIDMDSLQVDWLSIDIELAYRILNIPFQIKRVKQSCEHISEYVAGPPHYQEWFWERQIGFGKIGIDALSSAEKLRTLYKLPPQKFQDHDWSPRTMLEERRTQALKKKSAQDDRNATTWQEISALVSDQKSS